MARGRLVAELRSRDDTEVVWEIYGRSIGTYFARIRAHDGSLLLQTGAERRVAALSVTARLEARVRTAIAAVRDVLVAKISSQGLYLIALPGEVPDAAHYLAGPCRAGVKYEVEFLRYPIEQFLSLPVDLGARHEHLADEEMSPAPPSQS